MLFERVDLALTLGCWIVLVIALLRYYMFDGYIMHLVPPWFKTANVKHSNECIYSGT